MNLHEYQAKQLFAQYGLPVAVGVACDTAEQAIAATKQIGGDGWVIKVQVHAGGRGKAGGVKRVHSEAAIRAFCDRHIGTNLVTFQTDAKGQPVSKIYVEACTPIERELYFGAVIDRSLQRIVFMASTEGGVEIETVAAETPQKILQATIDPVLGGQAFQGRALAFQLGLTGKQVNQFANLFVKLAQMFVDKDLALLEINPLVVTKDGDIHCLDAKVSIDGNALYRQQALEAMRDHSQEDVRENKASEFDLNYVALEGNIGCMVNGAGLAMGTMDLVKLHGGQPANFLDVGGSATIDNVSEAFKIILFDENVKAVLINIFGGIVRCDIIAKGIIGAVKKIGVAMPVVVRFEGNNALKGVEILAASGVNIIAATSLTDAVQQVVKAAGGAS